VNFFCFVFFLWNYKVCCEQIESQKVGQLSPSICKQFKCATDLDVVSIVVYLFGKLPLCQFLLRHNQTKCIYVCGFIRCQFYQHFMCVFFIWKSFWQLFSSYMWVEKSSEKHFCTKKAHVKCWWNWLQEIM